MSKRILSMGTIAVDTVLNVDKFPEEDGFGHVISEAQVPGGSSANVAVALKQLGNTVLQTGKISDDIFGKIIRNNMKEEGIDERYLVTEPGGMSLHTYIVVDQDGRHVILANSGDRAMNLEAEEIPNQIFDEMDLFYTDLASPRAGLYLAEQCAKRKIPVIYNLQNPPMEEHGETAEVIDEMLDYTTLFITGSATICKTMKMEDTEDAVRAFVGNHQFEAGYICTMGTRGSDWFYNDGTEKKLHCGIVPVKSVDTTGAGDAYIAGIIHSYFGENQTREECMKLAAAVASMKTTQHGPRLHIDPGFEFDKSAFPEAEYFI